MSGVGYFMKNNNLENAIMDLFGILVYLKIVSEIFEAVLKRFVAVIEKKIV